MSFGEDGREVLVPTVSDDGRILSDDDAIALYKRTGKHLGIFRDVASANAYAQSLHEQQAKSLMTPPIHPTPAPNVELELAKLANDAMANGADPHEVTTKLHQTISYLRQFPHTAEHATNALADGIASPADISRTLWPHVAAMQHTNGAPGVSNAPTSEEWANLPGDNTARSRFGGGLASFVSSVPGGEALTTGAHALVNREPYADAYRDVKAAENTSPIKGALKFAGAIPAAIALPGNPVASGAIIGAADEALNADPNESLGERAGKTAAGAAIGAATGKVAQKVGTAIQALRPVALGGVGGADANVIARQAARAQSAKRLYAAAMAEGRGTPLTPEIQQFLNEEDIAPLVEKIKAGRTGSQLDTPELLDRVYKELSDMGKTAGKPLAAVDPSKPNLAVSRLADIKAAKQQALGAMSGTPSAPGPMPSYQQAVEDYAQRTREIDAVKRGYEAVKQNASTTLPGAKQLGRKTPLSFQEWAKTARPEEIAAARQGQLGYVRDAFARPGLTFKPGRQAISAAAPLLRSTPGPNQATLDALRNLGLLETSNQITQP